MLKVFVFLCTSFVYLFCDVKHDSFFLFSRDEISENTVFLLTIPKSGTHLITEAIYRTENKQVEKSEQNMLKNFPQIYENHVSVLADPYFYNQIRNRKIIIMIRDPRDALVSQIYHLLNNKDWLGMPELNDYIYRFQTLSQDERLMSLIQFPDKWYGICWCFKAVSKLPESDNILMCRYEDLVGSNGGESDELQLSILMKIREFLELDALENNDLIEIASLIYGPWDLYENGGTFRNGKIGNWNQYFNQMHKNAFKRQIGKELIIFGYEKDTHW